MTMRDFDRRTFFRLGAGATLGLLAGSVGEARADTFGTAVGSFNGVVAYSNGSNTYVSGQTNSVNGYTTGIRWQCVEFAARYFKAIYNLRIAGGNANTWYNNASGKGLNRFSNGGTTRPAVGDVLCTASGANGHVAIVREVGSNFIRIIHQNWNNTSTDNAKTLSMTLSGGRYTVAAAGSYVWQGWLRKR